MSEAVWVPVGWPGCEHVDVRADSSGVTVDGMVVAMLDARPVRLSYRIDCDAAWHVRRIDVRLYGRSAVSLLRRTDGRWYDEAGDERPELATCVDIDIALTPFTNTLPIRRLGLSVGESADLRVVYIQVGETLDVSAADQRYTRLDGSSGAGYRFESGSFVADLPVDADGMVVDYPGLWARAN